MIAAISFSCSRSLSPSMQTLPLLRQLLGPHRAISSTNDLGHARAVDEPIVDWLNANGAEADFIYLGDRGITGNGHMLMLERNSDALA